MAGYGRVRAAQASMTPGTRVKPVRLSPISGSKTARKPRITDPLGAAVRSGLGGGGATV